MLPACPVLEDMARRALALLAPGELARAAEGEALERLASVIGAEGG